jgi:YD repeat-containing protein
LHDAAGQLSVLIDPRGKRTSFAYDGSGREVGKTVAAAARVAQVFDPAG